MIFSATSICVCTLALLALPVFAAGNDKDDDNNKVKDKNYRYLALGDSVSFGLDIRLLPPFINPATQPLPKPDAFTGYPEVLADTVNADHVNASCPGETAASFLNARKPDNGCNGPGPQGQPPFKTSIGLRADYKGAQLDFAKKQLARNKNINLITLSIGGNEILLLLAECNFVPTCVEAALPAVLKEYAGNLGDILAGLRKHFKGTIVVMQYYSPSADLDGIAQALNGVMAQVSREFDVRLADGFAAFKLASRPQGGDACKAGLLIPLPPGPRIPPCDVHPTLRGQQVLATAVAASLLR